MVTTRGLSPAHKASEMSSTNSSKKTTTPPLITIVIPTFNRADHLGGAIESVVAQTYAQWELIVVDDGSTDHTREVVARYTKDPRIRYHFQHNRELNGARNTGVRLATGSYVGFLDDDDLFTPVHLAELTAAMQKTGGAYDIYRSGELLVRDERTTPAHNYRNGTDILPQYWAHPTGLLGMLIRTEKLRANPFNESLLLLDDFLWLVPTLRTASLWQVDAHTTVVHLHASQRSATYLADDLLLKNVHGLAAAYNLPGIAERVPFELYQGQVLHQYFHFSRQLGRRGERGPALRCWRRGLTYARLTDARTVARTLLQALTGR